MSKIEKNPKNGFGTKNGFGQILKMDLALFTVAVPAFAISPTLKQGNTSILGNACI
jgi:hypothetical protein